MATQTAYLPGDERAPRRRAAPSPAPCRRRPYRPDGAYQVNDLVLADGRPGRNIGVITRVGRIGGAEGCWVVNHTGDAGAGHSHPTFMSHAYAREQLAVIGRNVCDQPWGTHWCGLTHLAADILSWLPIQST